MRREIEEIQGSRRNVREIVRGGAASFSEAAEV